MERNVDNEIMLQAAKCEKDCACLSNGADICPVAINMDTGVLFVKYTRKRGCKYKMTYGYKDTICTCPVRKELYTKYQI
jgi:hypothetical protein